MINIVVTSKVNNQFNQLNVYLMNLQYWLTLICLERLTETDNHFSVSFYQDLDNSNFHSRKWDKNRSSCFGVLENKIEVIVENSVKTRILRTKILKTSILIKSCLKVWISLLRLLFFSPFFSSFSLFHPSIPIVALPCCSAFC